MTQFKDGDLVYCPWLGTQVLKVELCKRVSQYPIELDNGIDSETFTFEGLIDHASKLPQVFHATEENKKLLESLFGVVFESVPLEGCELVNQLLANGPLLCSVSVNSLEKAKTQNKPRIIVSAHSNSLRDGHGKIMRFWQFEDTEGNIWNFAVPFKNDGVAMVDV